MKKRTLRLAALSLMMTAMLFNCKDDDKDPTTPDKGISDQIKAIDLPAFTPSKPAEVTSTAGAVNVPAKATELNSAYANIAATGVVPASVTEANAVLANALSPSDMSALSSVSPAAIAAISAGGAMPAELKAIVDKAYADASMAAYLPSVTSPTVNGVAVKAAARVNATDAGARVGGTDGVAKTEAAQVDDACVTAANNLFNEAKAKLDASRESQTAQAAAAYAAATGSLATEQATCNTSATTAVAANRAAATTTLNTFLAFAEANQAALGAAYAPAVVNAYLAYFALLNSYNTLETESKAACTAIAAAKTKAAADAQAADLATITANYNAKLAEATTLRDRAIASCHNEGSGN